MKTLMQLVPILALLINLPFSAALAQSLTAFTYQGRLDSNGRPADGTFDFRLEVFDALDGGSSVSLVIETNAVPVTNGIFTIQPDFSFEDVFNGQRRWLELAVRPAGSPGAYEVLHPRQPLTPTPYALHANQATVADLATSVAWNDLTDVPPGFGDGVDNDTVYAAGNGLALSGTQFIVAAGGIQGAHLADGAVAAAKLSDGATLAEILDDDGPGSGLNADLLDGFNSTAFSSAAHNHDSAYWRMTGNPGTTPGTHFLGTTDNQPLELKVNGRRAWRLEPTEEDDFHVGMVNAVGGSPVNVVGPGVYGGVIGGGGAATYWADGVGFGGGDNQLHSDFGVIAGGFGNRIETNARSSTISGGWQNRIQTNAASSTISGGGGNRIEFNASVSTIGGGGLNHIYDNLSSSTIGGGYGNIVRLSASYSTIGGGVDNTVGSSANMSTIGGGRENSIQPSSLYGTIPGGYQNAATNYAFAAGTRAQANHTGSFVWADSTDQGFASTAADQFSVRANGGARFVGSGGFNNPQLSINKTSGDHVRLRFGVDSNPTWDIAVNGGATPQMKFYHAGLNRMVIDAAGNVSATAFNPTSDRAAKENFEKIDPVHILQQVLKLPMAEWSYKVDPGARHVGPVAQDFHAAFGVGTDDKHIATVDADGVALAAIQGLNQKLEEREAHLRQELQRRDAQNAALETRLKAMEQRVAKLISQGN